MTKSNPESSVYAMVQDHPELLAEGVSSETLDLSDQDPDAVRREAEAFLGNKSSPKSPKPAITLETDEDESDYALRRRLQAEEAAKKRGEVVLTERGKSSLPARAYRAFRKLGPALQAQNITPEMVDLVTERPGFSARPAAVVGKPARSRV